MRWISKVFALLVLITVTTASQSGPTDSFVVSAKLTNAGRTFGEPNAVVLANAPATVEVAGSDGYTLMVTVSDITANQIQVVANLDSPHGSMAPTIVVRPDEAASVRVGELGLEVTVRRRGG